jgi:hypothetical protein
MRTHASFSIKMNLLSISYANKYICVENHFTSLPHTHLLPGLHRLVSHDLPPSAPRTTSHLLLTAQSGILQPFHSCDSPDVISQWHHPYGSHISTWRCVLWRLLFLSLESPSNVCSIPNSPLKMREMHATLITPLLLKLSSERQNLHLGGKLIAHKQEHFSSWVK